MLIPRHRRTVPHIVRLAIAICTLASAASAVAQTRARTSAAPRGQAQVAAAPATPPASPVALERLSERARQQILALAAEKANRTPAQKKISSRLLYGAKSRRGLRIAGDITSLRSSVLPDANGQVDVEIRTTSITAGPSFKHVAAAVAKAGGTVLYGSETSPTVRALVPIDQLEGLAGLAEIAAIKPTAPFRTHGSAGAAATAGEVAHRVQDARHFFGVTGAGVKIGVLSDSVDYLEQSQASGDLPYDVTVLYGESGKPGRGEGTAMLEIIHDLAPGAKLFFATASGGASHFADNIRALRAAGCDIIVDDALYANESPFQDSVIARAVEEVTADGAFYFSSANNDGNLDDGTSSVWEGDYVAANGTVGPLLPGAGVVHDFGNGVLSNQVTSTSNWIAALYWSDPFGQSSNDYDLYVLDSSLSTVIAASNDSQDGNDDPIEATPGAYAGEHLVVVKFSGQPRALHLNNFGGKLTIATEGSTHGHNSTERAFGVAAVNVASAQGGPFLDGQANPVESFSADGLRRVFYNVDGVAFTPGNVMFATDGGVVRRKPDVTAADGVETTVPGFRPFFGTSAAAPHAAAIAALLKSAKPDIKMYALRQALTQSALDIEAPGPDRDAGFGILDAFGALSFINATPAPFLDLGTITTNITSGDGDTVVEPGETVSLAAPLQNIGGAMAVDVNATLTAIMPGIVFSSRESAYPPILPGDTALNNSPFVFTLPSTTLCGAAPLFALTASYTPGATSPRNFTFRVPTGTPSAKPETTSYTEPPVAIPDNTPAGVSIPFLVSGITSAVSDLDFRFDGEACSAAAGATTVGLEHSWIGDTIIRLRSPNGTIVTLANRPGGQFNEGNNFCNTVFDDDAETSIQSIAPGQAPFTGRFRPATPLATFNGEDPNGLWWLIVSDVVLEDSGNVRAFSVDIKGFECTPPATATTARRSTPLVVATDGPTP